MCIENENLNRAQTFTDCLLYCLYELGYDAKKEIEQIKILNFDDLPKLRENSARIEIIVKKLSIQFRDEPSNPRDGIIVFEKTSLRHFIEEFIKRRSSKPGGEIQLQSKLHDCLNSRTVIEACYTLDLPDDFPNNEFEGLFARKIQISSWPRVGHWLINLLFSPFRRTQLDDKEQNE